MPPDVVPKIQIQPSAGSKVGQQYITANGPRMPHITWARNGSNSAGESTIKFQITNARKPLASVSKIVAKGNRVIFSPEGSHIENRKTKGKVMLEEANGTYYLDVDYLCSNSQEILLTNDMRVKSASGFTWQA